MELKIINKKEDPLLSRTIIEAEIVFEKATPSRTEIKSKLVKDLGKDEKLIVVKDIHTSYGLKKAKNVSYVYENIESLKRIEVETKKPTKKKAPEEAKEKTEEKQEAKKEDAAQKPTDKNENTRPTSSGSAVSGTHSVGKEESLKEAKAESGQKQKEPTKDKQ